MEANVSCTCSTSSEELAWRSQSTAFCFTGHSQLAAFQLSGYKNIDIWDPEYMFICDFLQQNKTQFTAVPLSVHAVFFRLHPHLMCSWITSGEEDYTHYNTKHTTAFIMLSSSSTAYVRHFFVNTLKLPLGVWHRFTREGGVCLCVWWHYINMSLWCLAMCWLFSEGLLKPLVQ